MQHLKLTFEDIMQSKILYYDKSMESACFDICEYLHIDNMPAIDGLHYYELIDGDFVKEKIRENHKVACSRSLFQPENLQKFEANRHNVLFVFSEKSIRGVVHLSDYNRDIVLQSIQDDVLAFERKLRQLVILSNYNNIDMRRFFDYRISGSKKLKDKEFYSAKLYAYDKKINEINSLGAFQLFEFSDLLDFASSRFSNNIHKVDSYEMDGKLKNGKEILRELRNLAMHGKNPVSRNADTSIYSLESLKNLISSLDVLRQEYGVVTLKIRQHPDFLKSIELDNRGKLEIIHSHHPKALEYFLGF